MRTLSRFVIVASLVLSACGGGGSPSTPTPTPTPSNATVTGIVVSTLDFVRLNSPQRLVLSTTMSDGTTRVVEGTWESSDPAIATVAADGLVTGVASGESVITAQYQSFRAERRLRIVPDYAGQWDGGYRIANCRDEGDWEGFCEGEDPSIEWSLELTFTQVGGDVAGLVLAFEDVAIPVIGFIATNGQLAVGGSVNIGSAAEPFLVDVTNWDTGASNNNLVMNGRFEVVGSAPDLEGEFRYFCEVTVLNKTRAASGQLDGAPRRLVQRPRPLVPRAPR